MVFQVPADGILISGHSLSIDESSMTGESKHVRVLILTKLFFLIYYETQIITKLVMSISGSQGSEGTLLYIWMQGS